MKVLWFAHRDIKHPKAGGAERTIYANLVSQFLWPMHDNLQPVLYGDGTQRRDFIYINDNARASVLAMEKGKAGEAYNIGTGISTDFNAIYKIIKEEMGSKVEPKYEKNPFSSYQMFTQAVIEKAKNDLGFTPEYDIRSGVRAMLDQ